MAESDKLKQLLAAMEEAEKKSASSDKSWRNVAHSIDNITKSFEVGFGSASLKMAGIQDGFFKMADVIRSTFSGNNEAIRQFITAQSDAIAKAEERLQFIETFRSVKGKAGYGMGIEEKDLKREIRDRKAIQELASKTASLMHDTAFSTLPAFLDKLGKARAIYEDLNNQLIEAGSSAAERFVLMEKINSVQFSTGSSTKEMADATKALVNYGHDLTDNFTEALDIVTRMKVGLGVSAETSSRLLAVTTAVGGKWNEVADGIARVKEDTALAADQAARFAIEIENAMALLGPRIGVQAGGVVEYINRLEGSAQKLGLQTGSLKDALVGLTTERGIVGAATLGIDPTFLKDVKMTRDVVERYASYVNKTLAGTTGTQRIITMQVLAEQLNTSVDVIGRINEIVADQNKQRKSQITLEDAFTNQTRTLTEQWNRLKNSMGAIINAVLLPIITAINLVIKPISWLAEVTRRSEKALWALSAAMTWVMIVQLGKMATAVKSAALLDIVSSAGRGSILKGASNLFGRLLGARAAGAAVSAGTSAATHAARATGWQLITKLLPRIGTSLFGLGGTVSAVVAGSVLAIGAAVTAGVVLGTNYYYKRKEALNLKNQNDYVKSIAYGTGKSMTEWREETQRFLRYNRSLSAKDIETYIVKSSARLGNVEQAVMKGDKAQAMRLIEGVGNEFNKMYRSQRYRIGMAEGGTNTNEQRKKADQALIDIADKVITSQEVFARGAEESAKQLQRELQYARATRSEALEWLSNGEAAMRSIVTNSSPSSTSLNREAGILNSNF